MTTVSDAVLENRENIPLQKGKTHATLCNCEHYLSGSKNVINVAFTTLTIIITAALLVQIYYGDYQVVPHGSVATDSLECSKIGTAILKKGGNSIDASIASLLCLTVVTPHLASLDGDAQLLFYNHRTRNTPISIKFQNENTDHLLPRLVIGLAFLHQKFAHLTWKELVEPAADLAKRGFLVTKTLVQAIAAAKAEDLYGRLEAGRLLQLENLGNTLEQIANIPETELYSFLKPDNIPDQSDALKFTFNEYNIYVPNGNTSMGPIFQKNLQQLSVYNFTSNDTTKTEYVYRLAELTQNLYENLNISSRFHQSVSSTIAVMDLNDNYVSLTTGLYSLFGSVEITASGYTLDVHPQPLPASRLPLIVTDGGAICGRRLLFAADDASIATQLIMALLVAHENVTTAVNAPRFHILFGQKQVGVERFHAPFFSDDVIAYLETLGTGKPVAVGEPYAGCNVVEKIGDELTSHSDSRSGGIASRF